MDAIRQWPTLRSKKDVRSFLGLAGYYRRFIPNFSEIASPLTQLTRKSVKFKWDENCDNAFQKLKESLITSPVLSFPIDDGLFILDTDASNFGMGAVLSQQQNGEEKVLAYASHTLNKSQQNYCTTKKELLAVVTFLRQFKHYLLGRKILLRTDHASLRWLRNFKEPEGMLARWLSIVDTFDLEIQHRPGTKHQNADSLSRIQVKCKNLNCPCCDLENKESVFALSQLSNVLEDDPKELDCKQSNYPFHIFPIIDSDNSEDLDDHFHEADCSNWLQNFTKR